MSSAWKIKRFWTSAHAVPAGEGFAILLDDRPVRTPARAPLIVPTRALALAIAAEWDAQIGDVRPDAMPLTRMANSAIDKVAFQHGEVADLLAAYGDSDLLCYRAPGPSDLVALQAAAWDPILVWASQALGVQMAVGAGVVHVPQDAAVLVMLQDHVHRLDSFRMAAFHDLVALSGSLLIALAVCAGKLDADEGWDISRIDENWQAESWGRDDEALALAAKKSQDFRTAARFFTLLDETAA